MNIIQQAAEAKYPYNGTPTRTEKERGWYKEDVTHFLQFLSQQGDEEIVDSILIADGHHPSAVRSPIYGEDRKHILQALAIGRATNRWIPVSERLPEEKDAVEWNGVKMIEIMEHDFHIDGVVYNVPWNDKEAISCAAYWRTPAYPEPPKQKEL